MTEREWQAIDSLAKDEWEVFRQRLKAECEHMASVTPLNFRYTETTQSLTVERYEGAEALRTLHVSYDPAVPRIVWRCMDPFEKSGWFTFRLAGSRLLYLADNINMPLPMIITRLTMCLTGQL
jgi:hypothetical protein